MWYFTAQLGCPIVILVYTYANYEHTDLSLGKGISNQIALSNNHTTPIAPSLIPSVDIAVTSYEETQGRLTQDGHFGTNPLKERLDLVNIRDQQFSDQYSYEDIFTNSVSGDGLLLINSICYFRNITLRSSQLI